MLLCSDVRRHFHDRQHYGHIPRGATTFARECEKHDRVHPLCAQFRVDGCAERNNGSDQRGLYRRPGKGALEADHDGLRNDDVRHVIRLVDDRGLTAAWPRPITRPRTSSPISAPRVPPRWPWRWLELHQPIRGPGLCRGDGGLLYALDERDPSSTAFCPCTRTKHRGAICLVRCRADGVSAPGTGCGMAKEICRARRRDMTSPMQREAADRNHPKKRRCAPFCGLPARMSPLTVSLPPFRGKHHVR